MRTLLRTGAFVAGLFGATVAAFATPALVTTDLNLRTGPGTGYPRITAMPDGAIVDVTGCVRGYNWCRVHWAGYDGWASSNYLAFRSGEYVGRPYSSYGASVGIPLIAGAVIGGIIASDDDDYYDYHRHWRHRGDWRDHRDWRRHERRERRAERRERRHDRRVERRERRHERRAERRERRHERRIERRGLSRQDRCQFLQRC
jgi:uncharacterized protein YraI